MLFQLLLSCLVLVLITFNVIALGGNIGAINKKAPTKVVVTGAGSSVGYYVFKKLLKSKSFTPVGLVRDKNGEKQLIKLGAQPEQIFRVDITNKNSLKGVFDGASKAILCTSARPKKRLTFRIKSFFARIFGKTLSAKDKNLYYAKNEDPYMVDYIGQKNIIDCAVQSNIEHIVLLGNMGGYRGSKLDDIGRTPTDTDGKKGNILKWKRAAERYLMRRCFFTIIHAGALTDEKGGEREIVWDTDDSLLRTSFRKIPKEDVAEVLVQSLVWREAIGRSIDIASRPVGQGSGPIKDWQRFWSRPGNCLYPFDKDGMGGSDVDPDKDTTTTTNKDEDDDDNITT
eukprot:gene11168-23336_t